MLIIKSHHMGSTVYTLSIEFHSTMKNIAKGQYFEKYCLTGLHFILLFNMAIQTNDEMRRKYIK